MYINCDDSWDGDAERLKIFNRLMIKDVVLKDYRNMGGFIEYVIDITRDLTELEIALSCSRYGYIPFGAKVEKIEGNTYRVTYYKG